MHGQPRPAHAQRAAGDQLFKLCSVEADFAQNLQAVFAQARRRVFFCGSYAMPGIPLLESAVASARRVADAVTST